MDVESVNSLDDPMTEFTSDNEATADDSAPVPVTDLNLNISDWVVVQYDGVQFPGDISAYGSPDEVEVNCMEKSGKCW